MRFGQSTPSKEAMKQGGSKQSGNWQKVSSCLQAVIGKHEGPKNFVSVCPVTESCAKQVLGMIEASQRDINTRSCVIDH